ncbi:hypothetical protein K9D52_004991 [Salmonella enterica]|nr:hypothetical protein [Salmonella enterica]ELI0427349.1 hypothetical protein [Salmonella enterica]
MLKKKGIYNVSTFFSGWEGFSQSSDKDILEKNAQERQSWYDKVHYDVNGRILIYDFYTRRLFHDIEIPPAGDTRYQDGMYIIDKLEIGESSPGFYACTSNVS